MIKYQFCSAFLPLRRGEVELSLTLGFISTLSLFYVAQNVSLVMA